TKIVKKKHYKRYPRSKVVVVKRRNPRIIKTLPIGYSTYVYRRNNYFFHNGYFYRNQNNAYTIIAPPRGIRIKTLPVGYRKIIMYKKPHFYYKGTFYREINGEYESVEPEIGAIVPDIPLEIAEEVVVDNVSCYEIADFLYKSVDSDEGNQYEVVGQLEGDSDE
ncbi:MAG: DUF6515 family protein, partial [Bacteroidales bacterium]|nr:DUF6515 family protein [Bacteroidales bacterium]